MSKPVVGAAAACSLAVVATAVPLSAQAGPELSAGIWWVYENVTEDGSFGSSDELDNETGGTFTDPALIVYASDDDSHGPWHFSGEMRIGTGSFTSPANNNSGDNFTLHKGWIGYDFSDDSRLTVGKSQVPFGWKTVNFWPGDGLQGGYGDQMDVGLKLSNDVNAFHYDVAYYHQDDWGETSTDTVDDNGHWGTSDTYRKVKTGVVNGDWTFIDGHTFGVSYQYGRMQDLAAADSRDRNDEGRHQALDVHYVFEVDDFYAKYRYIDTERDFDDMDALIAAQGLVETEVETQRHIVELGYTQDRWFYYLDAGYAESDTDGNDSSGEFYSPGVSYNYGPGWLYLEYLWQNSFVGADGDIGEGDFRAVYASFDFYF